MKIKKFFKQLFCSHKYNKVGKPYLYENGMTKRCNVKCTKCGKETNVDIFDIPLKKWSKEDN